MTSRPGITLSFDPPGPQFAISEQAVMPKITVTAAIENIASDPHALLHYSWTVKLRFAEPRCAHSNGKVTTHSDITLTTTSNSFTIPFTLVRGGNLTVGVTVAIADRPWSAERADLKIAGTNPTAASLSAAVLGAPDAFKRLMRLESQLRQFRAASCPLFSADNLGSVGLCQLTPPSSNDQIWDWKKNVKGGLALCREKEAVAKAYSRRVRASAAFKAQVKAYNASVAAAALAGGAHHGPAAAGDTTHARPAAMPDPVSRATPGAIPPKIAPAAKPITVTVPEFTPAQLELDTIRAFNGYAAGLHEYRLKTDANGILVVTPDATGTTGMAEWERITAARTAHYDAVALPLGRRGDPNYVDDVLKQPVSDMRYWLVLAAALSVSAAPLPAARMYVVGCGGQVDTIDTATGAVLRSADVARGLPIKRLQTVAGATFDGCLLNQAVYVKARSVFYSAVPDQFSDKSDGTKDYHVYRFTVPGLRPARLFAAGTSLDTPPELAATPDGSVRVADPAPTEMDLSGFGPKGAAVSNQIIETSGGRTLVRLFGPGGLVLAVADLPSKRLMRLNKLPATTALNAHLAPGGSQVYVEEVAAPPTKTGRAFVFDSVSGRQVKMVADPRIAAMSFVALSPDGKAVYRGDNRYAVIALSTVFADQIVVHPAGGMAAVFFADK